MYNKATNPSRSSHMPTGLDFLFSVQTFREQNAEIVKSLIELLDTDDVLKMIFCLAV